MNIVVLDGYALNPGDLDWASLNSLGDVTHYERTEPQQIVDRLAEADIAIVNKVVVTKEVLSALPQLKAVLVTATGYNNVDLSQAKKQGVTIHNVPAYSTDSVVQLVFSFILHFARQVVLHNETVQSGRWQESNTFCYWDTPQIELNGKTIGIIGYGNIGKGIAKVAQAFGMSVLVSSRRAVNESGVTSVDKKTLFQESDFLCLACALTPDTELIVNEGNLSLMKQSACVINTGRGPLVDDEALVEALESGKIAGAAVDVLTQEPPVDGSSLIGTKNCLVTPHIGWATLEARQRCLTVTCQNVRGVISGKLVNQVGQ